jgi:hypothetical protein
VAIIMALAGARAICIYCAEFSLVAQDISAPVPVFDAPDLLVGRHRPVLLRWDPSQRANRASGQNLNQEKDICVKDNFSHCWLI